MHDLTKIERWLKALIFAGLLVFVAVLFSQKTQFTAVDLGRHLENGKIIWSDRQVLFRNLYSYTEPGTAFINHHWLAGVIFYAVYLLGGFKLLTIFNVLLILAAFILAFKLARKKAGFYIPALVSMPVIFLLSERVEIRPEIFSYFFIFLTWYLIDRAATKKENRLPYWLIPLFMLWANIHIYFFIGLALVAIKAASEFLPAFIKGAGRYRERWRRAWPKARSWVINFGWLALACLFNPNFFRGLLYPFNIFQGYGYEIVENKSIFYLENLTLNANIPIFKWLLFALVLSFIAAYIFTKKIDLFNLLSGFFFSFLGLFAVRNLSLFGLSSLVLLSANLAYPLWFCRGNIRNNIFWPQFAARAGFRLLPATFLVAVIFGSIIFLFYDASGDNRFARNSLGWGLAQGSEDSIAFFRDNNLSGPVFNNYDLGSALIFWLYPQEKVFVDNRPEAYSTGFFSDIYRPMQLERDKWLEYSAKYKFKTIYFSHTDATPWAQAFLSGTIDDDWALVYFDRYAVILLSRKNNDPETIKRLALDQAGIRTRLRDLAAVSGQKDKLNLATLAVLIKQPDLAQEIYQGILFSDPDNASALCSLGNVYADSSDRADLTKAGEYYQRCLKSGYRLPGIYNQMGLVDWRLGDYAAAEADWREALKIQKKNATALYYLRQAEDLRAQGRLP